MSGNKGIKKKELHSEASGIEELIAILPPYTLWCSREAANLTPRNVSDELPAITLLSDLQPCDCLKWCFPGVLPCTTSEVGVLDNAGALVLQQRERAIFSTATNAPW